MILLFKTQKPYVINSFQLKPRTYLLSGPMKTPRKLLHYDVALFLLQEEF